MQRDFQQEILTLLKEEDIPDTLALADSFAITHSKLDGLLKGLLVPGYVELHNLKREVWQLTPLGLKYSSATPEFQLLARIPPEGAEKDPLSKQLGEVFQLGFPICMKKKWVAMEGGKTIKRKVQEVQDEDAARLTAIGAGEFADLKEEHFKDLKSRKLIELKATNYYRVSKGAKYRPTKVTLVPDLTSEMLAKGSWETQEFRPFNLEATGVEIHSGSQHPLMKVRQEFRQILLEMGFEEMKTDQYVESSFWNFDSLFQPQNHPARDAHDTFFVSAPEKSKVCHPNYWEAVKQIHEKGGFGSLGYDYHWKESEAQKNILRTHTTAVSAKTLFAIAAAKDFRPRKFFSIDRVFRNEAIDKTHLAQFHQVEGFILDRGLGLGHLKGVITEFFAKIGIKKLWFKPAYNPYTEPSMQIFGYHPQLKKRIEIGNSGVFRPEMLRPMGFPEDMQVVAWGLSLERPTMINYGISSITELMGPTVRMTAMRKSPVACFHS